MIIALILAVGARAQEGDDVAPTTEAPKIPCDAKGKVCVEPKLCNRGFIDGNTLSRNYNYVSGSTGFCFEGRR